MFSPRLEIERVIFHHFVDYLKIFYYSNFEILMKFDQLCGKGRAGFSVYCSFGLNRFLEVNFLKKR